jgi:hypothetical protein
LDDARQQLSVLPNRELIEESRVGPFGASPSKLKGRGVTVDSLKDMRSRYYNDMRDLGIVLVRDAHQENSAKGKLIRHLRGPIIRKVECISRVFNSSVGDGARITVLAGVFGGAAVGPGAGRAGGVAELASGA